MAIIEQNQIEEMLRARAGQDAKADAKAAASAIQVDVRDVARLLNMRVQLEVVLAERMLPFGKVLKLAPGSIIEFDRSSDSELTLAVGNRKIGGGQAVKVGEYFGLHITWLGTLNERIRALGG
jgi:flagellar motor switch protein FliN/FliY